nr:polysaccharide pyruvyl transferase family protein [Motilibacter deserti]
MRLALRLGGAGSVGARLVRGADAVLDVSGGDSFAGTYGEFRFRTVLLPKLLALQAGRPLVLLPQTYGPFPDPAMRAKAARVVRAAHAAWARDSDSHDALRELLGDEYDPQRHRLGVDMAFALPVRRPDDAVADAVERFVDGDGAPVAGVNVSGLLYNDPTAAARYGLSVDYPAVVRAFVERLCAAGARVLLVPHVLGPAGLVGPDAPVESDTGACLHLAAQLPERWRDRVHVVTGPMDATQAKWVISRTSWFTGARMHATIGALSSGVPTAALAYSMKFRGVFASVGAAAGVVDARRVDDATALDALLASWEARDSARGELARSVQEVARRAASQMEEVVGVAESGRHAGRLVGRGGGG